MIMTGLLLVFELGSSFELLFKPALTICHDVKQGVHNKCPQGSIRTSLSFSAQILHSWNVLPISQYSSYCSCVTAM